MTFSKWIKQIRDDAREAMGRSGWKVEINGVTLSKVRAWMFEPGSPVQISHYLKEPGGEWIADGHWNELVPDFD